jgi:hypothetical protein
MGISKALDKLQSSQDIQLSRRHLVMINLCQFKTAVHCVHVMRDAWCQDTESATTPMRKQFDPPVWWNEPLPHRYQA